METMNLNSLTAAEAAIIENMRKQQALENERKQLEQEKIVQESIVREQEKMRNTLSYSKKQNDAATKFFNEFELIAAGEYELVENKHTRKFTASTTKRVYCEDGDYENNEGKYKYVETVHWQEECETVEMFIKFKKGGNNTHYFQFSVEEHITGEYRNRTNNGWKLHTTDADYHQKWYGKAKNAHAKVMEVYSAILLRQKQQQMKLSELEMLKEEIETRYPQATITVDKDYHRNDYGRRNSGGSYYTEYVKATFENGLVVKFTSRMIDQKLRVDIYEVNGISKFGLEAIDLLASLEMPKSNS